jgi:hypothetical protein
MSSNIRARRDHCGGENHSSWNPPRRLVQTMARLVERGGRARGTSRVTWEIEPVGDSCRLNRNPYQLRQRPPLQPSCTGGWPMILPSEDLARNRSDLDHPGSLMYGAS